MYLYTVIHVNKTQQYVQFATPIIDEGFRYNGRVEFIWKIWGLETLWGPSQIHRYRLTSTEVGVTKAPFVDFSAWEIFDLAEVPVRFLESLSYLTGVTAARNERNWVGNHHARHVRTFRLSWYVQSCDLISVSFCGSAMCIFTGF